MHCSRWIPAAALLCTLLPASAADLPRKAPDYTINLNGGKSVTLSQYRGRAVVFAFIYTACTHCQATVGVLNKLQNEYGPKGLQVLACAINPDAASLVPLFIKNFSPPYPVGYSTPQLAAAFIQPTGKSPQMPLIAFIDREGVMRAQTEGEDPFFDNLEPNLRKQIEALLRR